MKKIIICFIAALVLSNCEIKVKQANSQIIKTLVDNTGHSDVYIYRYVTDSMEYRVFHTGNWYGGMHVINITKDKLEIKLLKKQLNKK